MDYRQAGVNIDEGVACVTKIKEAVRATRRPGVIGALGGFGGLFHLKEAGFRDPVLVSSVDGVGTKLIVAAMAGQVRGLGIDLVHHCINDILVHGATPLFFLDYVAMGRLDSDRVAQLIEGLASACAEHDCALIGGETAEMPGLYRDDDFDLVGTVVGAVERRKMLDGKKVREGDVAVGLFSRGLHTNGYSLARRILFDLQGFAPESALYEGGPTVAQTLLEVHRCYAPALRPALERGDIHALAHITGGGLLDNLPRAMPKGLGCSINRDAWETPVLFRRLAEWGEVAELEMFRTFNMGIGMVALCAPEKADALLRDARAVGDEGAVIGSVAGDDRALRLA